MTNSILFATSSIGIGSYLFLNGFQNRNERFKKCQMVAGAALVILGLWMLQANTISSNNPITPLTDCSGLSQEGLRDLCRQELNNAFGDEGFSMENHVIKLDIVSPESQGSWPKCFPDLNVNGMAFFNKGAREVHPRVLSIFLKKGCELSIVIKPY